MINKNQYRILSSKEVYKLIKKLATKNFNYKTHIKSEEDWWDLANFSLQFAPWWTPSFPVSRMIGVWHEIVGKIQRSDMHTDPDRNLQSVLYDLYFKNTIEESGTNRWYWPQGRRQSFTYKFNRILENIQEFLISEFQSPKNAEDGQTNSYALERWNRSFVKKFGIQSLYSVSSRGPSGYGTSKIVGVVESNDLVDAHLQFSMFVLPLLGLPQISSEDLYYSWEGFVSIHQKNERYLYLNSDIISRAKSEIQDLENRIKQLTDVIEYNGRVVQTAQNNLLIKIGLDNKAEMQDDKCG